MLIYVYRWKIHPRLKPLTLDHILIMCMYRPLGVDFISRDLPDICGLRDWKLIYCVFYEEEIKSWDMSPSHRMDLASEYKWIGTNKVKEGWTNVTLLPSRTANPKQCKCNVFRHDASRVKRWSRWTVWKPRLVVFSFYHVCRAAAEILSR